MLNAVTAAGAALIATLAGSAAPSAAAPGPPPPAKLAVDVVSNNGTGCPAGESADAVVAPDGSAFTITYSGFTAAAGGLAPPLDFRKNCQVTLNVAAPKGYTWAVARIDHRGFAHLEKGASAQQQAFFYFQGTDETGETGHRFNGPSDGGWQRVNKLDLKKLKFLPCGDRRYLNVNVELAVEAGRTGGTSLITMDSTDGSVYHVALRKC